MKPLRNAPLRSTSALFAALLLTQTLPAQSSDPTTPPTCHSANEGVRIDSQPQRPTAASIQATAEAAAADPTFLVSAEPLPNFGAARYRLADYAECTGNNGCYWTDLDAQTHRAEFILNRLVATHRAANPTEKLAIVLDIDETSLSAYCEEKREDYGFIPSLYYPWVISSEASIPIPGTLRLFNRARSLNVDVFFITGRGGDETQSTSANLTRAGYSGWKGLILRDDSERTMPTVQYKSSERAKIVAQGYTIILNMGDQWSDLNGAPKAEISVKLPNPFYYLP
jgi:hypothetical protein